VEEDGVVGHRRYVNLARSLDMPYSLGNIVSTEQATHKDHHGALLTKSRRAVLSEAPNSRRETCFSWMDL